MATENTETNAGTDADTGPTSESNEHDYAHTADANFASSGASAEPVPPSASPPVEHPEPAVGAEVDCPGGSDAEPRKTASAPPVVGRGSSRRPRRPEDRNCSCCKLQFERQGRSFNRRAVYTFTSPDTVHWAFPGSAVHDKSFVCETCAQVVRSKCKRRQSGKRSLWLRPAETKQLLSQKASRHGCVVSKSS